MVCAGSSWFKVLGIVLGGQTLAGILCRAVILSLSNSSSIQTQAFLKFLLTASTKLLRPALFAFPCPYYQILLRSVQKISPQTSTNLIFYLSSSLHI